MILYFSSTGNSKFVAEILKMDLQDTAVSLNHIFKNNLKSYWHINVVSFEEKYYFQNNRDLNLQELIFKLSPRYKGVVHLYYYEGYSVKEIAAILKISDSAVKQRLKRAREKLKIELEVGS